MPGSHHLVQAGDGGLKLRKTKQLLQIIEGERANLTCVSDSKGMIFLCEGERALTSLERWF